MNLKNLYSINGRAASCRGLFGWSVLKAVHGAHGARILGAAAGALPACSALMHTVRMCVRARACIQSLMRLQDRAAAVLAIAAQRNSHLAVWGPFWLRATVALCC